MSKETDRLAEVDSMLMMYKNTYEQLFPIWNAIDRKKRDLDLQISLLTDERNTLKQGQLLFTEEF